LFPHRPSPSHFAWLHLPFHTCGNEEIGFYAQGGYTYLNIEPEGADSGIDTNALTARAGNQFTPMFSLEADVTTGIDDGQIDYNVDEDEFNLDGNDDTDLNDVIAGSGDLGLNYLVGLYGRASLPVTGCPDISVRADYALVDVDASVITPGGATLGLIEDSADGTAIGAGLTFDLTENWELRAEYTYYNFEETDTGATTIAVGYKFQACLTFRDDCAGFRKEVGALISRTGCIGTATATGYAGLNAHLLRTPRDAKRKAIPSVRTWVQYHSERGRRPVLSGINRRRSKDIRLR
jgi:opacity protein-like surface antigen